MNSLSVIIFAASATIAFGFQNFAQGGYQFPGSTGNIPRTPSISGSNDRGSWNIGVNKDKGRGPQIQADGRGNIYTSPNGNWRVDSGAQWDAGKGRKPSYGGDISVSGRWRRAADPNAQDSNNQSPGNNDAPNPQVDAGKRWEVERKPGDRGSISVVGSEHGVQAQGKVKVWESDNKQSRLDALGNVASQGGRTNYGGGFTFSHRFKRDADEYEPEDVAGSRWRRAADPYAPGGYQFPGNNGARIPSTPGIHGGNDRGTWNIGVNKDKGRGPQIHADGRGNIYTSPKGNVNIDAGGRWEAGRGRKPTYGGDISIHGRVPRSAEPGDRGSISVSGSEHGVQAQGHVKVWESDNGRSRLDATGNVARQGGRTDYGGGVTFTHRFKRSAEYDPEEDVASDINKPTYGGDVGRVPRWTIPEPDEPDRGSISVTGSNNGIHAQGNLKVWESDNRRSRVDVHANVGRFGGRTDYGGGVTFTHRFKRDADEYEPEDDVTSIRSRRAADPRQPGDRGSISVTREQTRGQRPVYTAQGNAKIWESRDRKARLEGYGNAQRQHGRTNYGGGIQYTRKFKRDADLDELEYEPNFDLSEYKPEI